MTSTPKRVGLEELKESLRHCTQHCQSFYNRNGQPSLSPSTWPDPFSWDQARRAYKRNYDLAVARFSELAAELERPSVYETDKEPAEEEIEVEVNENVQITETASAQSR